MTLLPYCLKVLFCSGFLYAFYHFVLRNKYYHQYNRFYLLLLPVVSFLIPLVTLPFAINDVQESPVINTLSQVNVSRWEKEFVVYGSAPDPAYDFAGATWLILYLAGIALFIIPLINSFFKLKRIARQSSRDFIEDITLNYTDAPGTPFSFFNTIFWNKDLSLHTREAHQMLQHELFHVRQKHSLDNLYAEILRALFWVNPVFHLIRKELEVIHEFLADEHASKSGDAEDYAALLIETAISSKKHLLTNSFFNSQLKRRIAMITMNRGQKFNYIARLAVLPVVAFLFSTCGQHPESEAKKENETAAVTDTNSHPEFNPEDVISVVAYSPKDSGRAVKRPSENVADSNKPTEPVNMKAQSPGEITFTKTEIEASYPGGVKAWKRYLTKALRYPEEARKNNLQGFVVVQFIVDKDGTVSDVRAIAAPRDGNLSEQAIEVIRNSGKWEPAIQNGQKVRAYKKMPVNFKLISRDKEANS